MAKKWGYVNYCHARTHIQIHVLFFALLKVERGAEGVIFSRPRVTLDILLNKTIENRIGAFRISNVHFFARIFPRELARTRHTSHCP